MSMKCSEAQRCKQGIGTGVYSSDTLRDSVQYDGDAVLPASRRRRPGSGGRRGAAADHQVPRKGRDP